MSDKDRQKKDHKRMDKDNKRMREAQSNPRKQEASPRHQARTNQILLTLKQVQIREEGPDKVDTFP